jgi:O-methyltransferase
MRPTDTTVEGRLDELRNRVQLRTRVRRALGQPLWEQLAREARASADQFGLDDVDRATQRIIARTAPYTKTPPVRVVALCSAVEYVIRHDIPGAIVECGLWRGGSLMAAALRLADLGVDDRLLYGFDTFAGMTPPTDHDGPRQMNRWRKAGVPQDQRPENLAPGTSLAGVAALLASSGYSDHGVHLIEGPVEDTLPEKAPAHVSILRLDTDFYESTLHELTHLYPRLSRYGVLIIDDYGNLAGARKAVEEYFSDKRIFMHRIDHGARIAVKQE